MIDLSKFSGECSKKVKRIIENLQEIALLSFLVSHEMQEKME